MEPMNVTTRLEYQGLHRDYMKAFYQTSPVRDFTTTIKVTSQNPPFQERRLAVDGRVLQNNQLTLSYDQTVSYRLIGSSATPLQVVQAPFSTADRQKAFVNYLKDNSDNTAFDGVTGVSAVSAPQTDTAKDKKLSTGAIIGIAVGGGVLVLGGGLLLWSRYRGSGGYKSSGDGPSGMKVSGRDEISTLDEPQRPYGDQR
jgi:hypothetical protein